MPKNNHIRLTHLSAKSVRRRSADRAVLEYSDRALELASRFGAKSKPTRQALHGLEVCSA